jgi:nucleoside-diphosphate-sugar epimerase
MTKILITGTSGFIGNHLLHSLIKQDLIILGIDIVPPHDNKYLPFFKQTDLLDLENLIATVQQFQPDFIFHLAARTDLNETKDIRGYASNIEGVENLITAIRQTSSVKRCIFTSSQLVCKVGYVPKDEDEDDVPKGQKEKSLKMKTGTGKKSGSKAYDDTPLAKEDDDDSVDEDKDAEDQEPDERARSS